jgi:hypothetical protein
MKKVLLLAAATAFVATGFAQSYSKMTVAKENLQMVATQNKTTMVNPKLEKAEKLPLRDVQQQMRTAPKAKSPKKLIANGIFYSRPAGTLYGGWNLGDGGSGYYFTTLFAPAWTNLTFENKCTAEPTWTINGKDASDEVVDNNYVGRYSTSEERGTALYYTPTVSTTAGSYTLGEYNVYLKREYTTVNGIVRIDSLNCMYPSDPNAATLDNGQYYSCRTGWGLLDNDNLYGSGSYDDYGKAVYSAQVFPKPASPLFFTKIYVDAVTTTQPIPEGMKMRALITGVKDTTVTYQSGAVADVKLPDMTKIIDVLYAESADTLDFISTTTRNSKSLKSGYVVYSKPGEEDILGNIIPGNVVIDQEFAVVFADMEKEGVDFGIYANEIEDGDDSVESARIFFENGRFITYNGNLAMNMSLYGMFDKAFAPKVPGMYTFENQQLDYRIVTVPTTGSTNTYGYGNCTYGATASQFVEGAPENADGWAGVPVYTNVSWFDQDGNENYGVIGIPDWITNISIDDSFPYGLNNVMFFAEPLPAGEKGRYAIVNVVGQEADMNGETEYSTVSEPIAIVQGEVNMDEILAVKHIPAATKKAATGFTYSMTGQRVSSNYKGLVIRDGKKFINK